MSEFFFEWMERNERTYFYFFLCVRYTPFVHTFRRLSHYRSPGTHIRWLIFPLRKKISHTVCSVPCFTVWLSLAPFLHSLRYTHRDAVKKNIFFHFFYKRSLVFGGGGGGGTTKRWYFWAVWSAGELLNADIFGRWGRGLVNFFCWKGIFFCWFCVYFGNWARMWFFNAMTANRLRWTMEIQKQ